LYGATKLTSDKLFIAGNSYAGPSDTRFSVVRYGNVMGSRGSIIPYYLSLPNAAEAPVTDERMTRFMITLEQGVELVWKAFSDMNGGEIYVKRIPSMRISDVATACLPNATHKIIGIRPGEKLHEQMISSDDAPHTYSYGDYFKILPSIHNWSTDASRIGNGIPVGEGFQYSSDSNRDWMSVIELQDWIKKNRSAIGSI
jgi:FlaA1/EpsC-like NDP-sugar epimerase